MSENTPLPRPVHRPHMPYNYELIKTIVKEVEAFKKTKEEPTREKVVELTHKVTATQPYASLGFVRRLIMDGLLDEQIH